MVHQLLARGNLLFVQVNTVAFSLKDVVNNLPLQIFSELVLPHSFFILGIALVTLVRELSLSCAHHVLFEKRASPVSTTRRQCGGSIQEEVLASVLCVEGLFSCLAQVDGRAICLVAVFLHASFAFQFSSFPFVLAESLFSTHGLAHLFKVLIAYFFQLGLGHHLFFLQTSENKELTAKWLYSMWSLNAIVS